MAFVLQFDLQLSQKLALENAYSEKNCAAASYIFKGFNIENIKTVYIYCLNYEKEPSCQIS